MADPLDPPSYANNTGPGNASPADQNNREWQGRLPLDEAARRLLAAKADLDANSKGLLAQVPTDALVQPGNAVGDEVIARLRRDRAPASQFESPFPTAHSHEIYTDPDRHAVGLIRRKPGGVLQIAYRSAPLHTASASEIRLMDSLDTFLTPVPERTVYFEIHPTYGQIDIQGETGGTLADGRLCLVSSRRTPAGEYKSDLPPFWLVFNNDDTYERGELAYKAGDPPVGGQLAFGTLRPVPYLKDTDPDAREMFFYGGAIIRSAVRSGAGVWGEIEVAIAAGPAGTAITEPAVEIAPNGDSYMIIRDQSAEMKPAVVAFRKAGQKSWSAARVSRLPYGRCPPYILPRRPDEHYLVTRSGPNTSILPDYQSHLLRAKIDVAKFIASEGQDGFGPWEPFLNAGRWPMLMGGYDVEPNGEWIGLANAGESVIPNNTTQGGPARMFIISPRPSPTINSFVARAYIASGMGRIESVNGLMQEWINPAKQVAADGAKYLVGPIGSGVRRLGNALGHYIDQGSDGNWPVLDMGRNEGDQSTAPLFHIWVMGGEELNHLRGNPVTWCVEAMAGLGFTSANGILMNVLWGETEIDVTASDATFVGSAQLHNTKVFRLSKLRYLQESVSFFLPPTARMLVCRIGYYMTTPTAPAGDRVLIKRSELVRGDRPTPLNRIPLADLRAQCGRLFASTYDWGVVPGTPNVQANSLNARVITTAAESARLAFSTPAMAKLPIVQVYSSKSGVLGQLWNSSADADTPARVVLSGKKGSLITNRDAAPAAAHNMQAHVVHRADRMAF